MTKKIAAFVVCAIIILLSACINTVETKINSIKASILDIMLEYPNIVTECVGVAISKDGYILTTAHIIKEEYDYRDISIHCNINKTKYAVNIISVDRQKDLALLKCDRAFLSFTCFIKKDLYAGQGIYIAVNTLNNGINIGGAVINNKQVINYATYDRELLSIDTCIFSGYSGSPVVDKHGNAVGIICAKKASDKTTFFAIKSQTIIDFLED